MWQRTPRPMSTLLQATISLLRRPGAAILEPEGASILLYSIAMSVRNAVVEGGEGRGDSKRNEKMKKNVINFIDDFILNGLGKW